MGDDFEDDDGEEELFNDDFDDSETTLRPGVRRIKCPKCSNSLDYRVEGRFVVRFCTNCGYEGED